MKINSKSCLMQELKGFTNDTENQDQVFASRNQYSGSGDFSPHQ